MGNIPRARVFFLELSIYDVKLTLQHHMKIKQLHYTLPRKKYCVPFGGSGKGEPRTGGPNKRYIFHDSSV